MDNRLCIVADKARLELTPWNLAYGNKILHLLYVISLCEKREAQLVLPCRSNLDHIFDLDRFISTKFDPVPCAFTETTAFPGGKLLRLGRKWSRLTLLPVPFFDPARDAIAGSEKQFRDDQRFLTSHESGQPFSVKGHFWHYDLMPSHRTFLKFLKIRDTLIKQCLDQYPDLQSESSVAVHLRDTDFQHHLRHYFRHSIALDDGYYTASLSLAEKRLGKDITFHLFSDNPERIQHLFRKRAHVVHHDEAPMDWACLYLARNVIQSNSSFCWTASLYNKELSIQPAGGYNYHRNTGDVPFGFIMPFSEVVTKGGTEVRPKRSQPVVGTGSAPPTRRT